MKKVFKAACLSLVFASSIVFSQSIGEMHNNVLGTYYSEYGYDALKKNDDVSLLTERIFKIYQKNYPRQIGNVTIDQVKASTVDFFNGNQLAGFSYLPKVHTTMDNFVKNGKISQNYSNFILDIVDNNYDLATCNSKIEEYKKNHKMSTDETSMLADFEDVLQYSSRFWEAQDSSTNTNVAAKYKCKPSHQRMIGDAWGAFMGAALGGFAKFSSVIISSAIQHGQDSVGGGCW
ncbi:hypothetical protein [uncultured Chryseobacterium sp.]|uniref:hypothetical protein n=1 Tax=uncultured Chryseobacterium sp. TaxID=259322 RepID=UPI0025F95BE7|nr:hypothetical protein [uncultured Chryseobacterium sp.]